MGWLAVLLFYDVHIDIGMTLNFTKVHACLMLRCTMWRDHWYHAGTAVSYCMQIELLSQCNIPDSPSAFLECTSYTYISCSLVCMFACGFPLYHNSACKLYVNLNYFNVDSKHYMVSEVVDLLWCLFSCNLNNHLLSPIQMTGPGGSIGLNSIVIHLVCLQKTTYDM